MDKEMITKLAKESYDKYFMGLKEMNLEKENDVVVDKDKIKDIINQRVLKEMAKDEFKDKIIDEAKERYDHYFNDIYEMNHEKENDVVIDQDQMKDIISGMILKELDDECLKEKLILEASAAYNKVFKEKEVQPKQVRHTVEEEYQELMENISKQLDQMKYVN